MEILIFLVFAAIIILGVIFAYFQQAARRKELTELAARRGWSFQPGNDPSLVLQFGSLAFLEKGSDRYAYNVLHGAVGNRYVHAFDYHYETHSTDSKGNRQTHHHRFSVVALNTGLPLKPLIIRPEGFLDRVGEFFGLDDIDFESTEFSRAFHVTSPDRRWAFDVIHQATMEYLLAAPRFKIELAGPRVFIYRDNCFKAAEFESACEVAGGIVDRLPNYLLREWKGAVG